MPRLVSQKLVVSTDVEPHQEVCFEYPIETAAPAIGVFNPKTVPADPEQFIGKALVLMVLAGYPDISGMGDLTVVTHIEAVSMTCAGESKRLQSWWIYPKGHQYEGDVVASGVITPNISQYDAKCPDCCTNRTCIICSGPGGTCALHNDPTNDCLHPRDKRQIVNGIVSCTLCNDVLFNY